MFKKIFLILILFFSILFFPDFTKAGLLDQFEFIPSEGLVPCGKTTDPADACTLCHLIIGIKNIVDFGLYLLITISALAIFIAGVMYIVSSGNEELITKSKSFLKASLTGFTITIMAWFLVNIVMWAIDFQITSVDKVNWYTFECNT